MWNTITSYFRYFTHPKEKVQHEYQLAITVHGWDDQYYFGFVSCMDKDQLTDYIQKAIDSTYSGSQELYLGKHPDMKSGVPISVKFFVLRNAASWHVIEKHV